MCPAVCDETESASVSKMHSKSVAASTGSIAAASKHSAAKLMSASMPCQLVGSLTAHAASPLCSITNCMRFRSQLVIPKRSPKSPSGHSTSCS